MTDFFLFKNLYANRPPMVIIHGAQLGYDYHAWLQQEKHSIPHILIVENHREGFSNLIDDERVRFAIDLPLESVEAFASAYLKEQERLIYSARIEHLDLSENKNDDSYFESFLKSFKKAAQLLREANKANPEDSFRGLLNVTRNLSLINATLEIAPFENQFSQIPGIIVSSGPSLKYHLEDLKKYQSHFLIACCDSALQTLLQNGIKPHFVFTIERVAAVKLLFEGLDTKTQIPLFALPTTHPEVLAKYPGPIVMMPQKSGFGAWLWPDRQHFSFGATVATMALRALTFMGCRQVYLLGQDLAYDRKTRSSHIETVNAEVRAAEEYLAQTPDFCEVMGNDGEPIASTIYWRHFIQNFEQLISEHGLACYNVIEKNRGAKITNAIRTDPQDFWSEVSSKFAKIGGSASTKIQVTLAKAQGKKVDVNSLVKKTLDFLKQAQTESFLGAKTASLAFHNDMPLVGDEDEVKIFEQHFAKWQESQRELMTRYPALYGDFLYCLFSSAYLQILSAREMLVPEKEKMILYITQYVNLSIDFFKEQAYWSQRARDLLEHFI